MTNQTTAITTIDQAKSLTKPPPTKKVLLEATALALFQEQERLIKIADEQMADISRRELAFCRKQCRKLYSTGILSVDQWGSDCAVKVKIKISPGLLKPFNDERAKVSRPRRYSVQDFKKKLTETTQPQDSTVSALLADKVIAEKLLQLGRKMIGLTA